MGVDCNDYIPDKQDKPTKPIIIETVIVPAIDKAVNDKPVNVQPEATETVPVNAVPCEIKAREDNNIKTVVIDKPLSLKHSLFCEYIVKHGLQPLDAYCKVYNHCKRSLASGRCTRLLKDKQISVEIDRLRKTNNINYQETINNLHGKAVETLESIMVNSDKDSVRLGAVNAVINRTVPVIAKSMHVGVKVTREEIDRRYNALQE